MRKKRNPQDNATTMAIVGGLGLAAVGAYVWWKGKQTPPPTETEFRALEADYGTIPIELVPGGSISFDLFFEYQGSGGEFDMGVGLAPSPSALESGNRKNDVEEFLANVVKLDKASAWKRMKVNISAIVPGSLKPTSSIPGASRRSYDALKFIQVKGGRRDKGGNGYLLSDWDDDVFSVKALTAVGVVEIVSVGMGVE